MSQHNRMLARLRKGGKTTATPQECPSCKHSLHDDSVPPHMRPFQDRFTLALSSPTKWKCPFCGHEWDR